MKQGIDYIGVGCGALIVNDQNQVLLIHRTDKTGGGGGGFRSRPGGAVEFGEIIEEAIIREIREELNVDVELFGPNLYANDIREEKGVLKHRFTGGRFARIISGELKNMEPEKHDKIGWFDIDSIPDNLNEYTKQSIDEYIEYISG